MKESNLKNWRKNFFTIWTGQIFSQFSSSILQFAIVWHLTERTGSAMILSMAMLMGFLPQAILGPLIGVVIDRYQRKKIMIWSDLGIAAASFALVVADWTGNLSIGLIFAVLLARSVGTAFHTPCLQAVTPSLVPEDQLTRCAGYSHTLQSISDIFSPALAAVLYQMWSLGSIVLLDVCGAVIAVGALCISRIPETKKQTEQKEIHVIKEAVEGFQVLRTQKGIMGLVLISALYVLALMPTSALFPLMSMSYFGGTSIQASTIEIVFYIGLLIGSLILSAWGGTKNRVYTIIGSYLIMGISLCISGLLPPEGFGAFAVCSWFMGFSGPFYWGMYTPILQSHFADEYLGRVMALAGSIRFLCSPIGLSLSGLFAGKFGVEKWFLVAGAMTFAAAVLCFAIPVIRRCDSSPTSKGG